MLDSCPNYHRCRKLEHCQVPLLMLAHYRLTSKMLNKLLDVQHPVGPNICGEWWLIGRFDAYRYSCRAVPAYWAGGSDLIPTWRVTFSI